MLAYISLRQDAPGAFFITEDKAPVTKSWFVQQIRVTLSSIGLPQADYAGHSFRIGAATSAALAGIEDSTIQALGRWQSAAFLQYIWMPREQLASISRLLASAAVTPHKHQRMCELGISTATLALPSIPLNQGGSVCQQLQEFCRQDPQNDAR